MLGTNWRVAKEGGDTCAGTQSIAKQACAYVQLHGRIEHRFNQFMFFLLLSRYLNEIRDCLVSSVQEKQLFEPVSSDIH